MLSENIRDSEGSLKQCLITVLLSVVINRLGILNTHGPISYQYPKLGKDYKNTLNLKMKAVIRRDHK